MKHLSVFVILFLLVPVPAIPSLNAKTPAKSSTNRARAVSAPMTQLSVHDWYGHDYFYDLGSGGSFSAQSFDKTGDGLADYIRISFTGTAHVFWFLDFSTNKLNRNISVGHYAKAQRATIAQPGHAGFEVSGVGIACVATKASFTILDSTFDNSVSPPRVISFAAEFEQRCENVLLPSTGTIYYNFTPNSSLAVSPATVNGGESATGTVTLDDPAPAGGAAITLVSSDTSVATVPASLGIKAGMTSAHFAIKTKIVKSPPSVVILAIYQGIASAATLQVISPIPSITKLEMHSQPGDYVGQGQNYLYTDQDLEFVPSTVGPTQGHVDIVHVYLSKMFSGFEWDLFFSTRGLGTDLVPGFYPDGQRYGFEMPGHPGLSIGGLGRGCNEVTGSFRVIEATYDTTSFPADLITLAIEFEQHCEGEAPALTGTLYFNYTPGPVYDMCIQDDSSGSSLKLNSNSGEYLFSTCAGFQLGGTGEVTRRGGTITLQHNSADRRIFARIDTGAGRATATIQLFSPTAMFTITDRNTANNTCTCGGAFVNGSSG